MTLDYAARQIAAAWKMAFNLPGWGDELDRTIDGVFRSFFSALVVAPFAVLSFLLVRSAARQEPELAEAAILNAPLAVAVPIQISGFALDWAGSLAILVVAARALGASRRVADVIVGYNWVQAPVTMIQLVPLAAANVAGPLATALFLPTLALMIVLYWGVLRRSLGAGPAPTAALIVALAVVGVLAGALTSGVGLALAQYVAPAK